MKRIRGSLLLDFFIVLIGTASSILYFYAQGLVVLSKQNLISPSAFVFTEKSYGEFQSYEYFLEYRVPNKDPLLIHYSKIPQFIERKTKSNITTLSGFREWPYIIFKGSVGLFKYDSKIRRQLAKQAFCILDEENYDLILKKRSLLKDIKDMEVSIPCP